MCGIAGVLTSERRDDLSVVARRMADALAHRGPDGEGVWAEPSHGVAFGHRRLAIVDLTPAGAQPMESACGRYVISYNGELYNTDEIRRELLARGHNFRGHSDTEVIVEACAAWGVPASVRRLNGMFAFAVWDLRERVLWLARDHFGIKPLFWGHVGTMFVFASELKALQTAGNGAPGWTLDRQAAADMIRLGYVPAPRTIFREVAKLEPGTLLCVGAGEAPRIERYWDLSTRVAEVRADPFRGDEAEAADALDALLRDAVKRQMVSDVPLGAFLSGGIDSSTVVALMQAQSSERVKTFSIGFAHRDFNEAPYAARVARHLGTDHHELVVDPMDALALIPRLPEWYDEPFGDSSQIPTYLVSQLARRTVTVALSGDGGDELFAGYTRYAWAHEVWPRLAMLPAPLRSLAARMIRAAPRGLWHGFGRMLPRRLRTVHLSDMADRLAEVLEKQRFPEAFRRVASQWDEGVDLVPGAGPIAGPLADARAADVVASPVEKMQLLDAITYLPDDILTKVDRASMAVSLEVRVPVLDIRVAELAWRMPLEFKMRQGEGKQVLRRVLHRYVPRQLVERPKMGFSVPLAEWLRGPLRDWAEDLLDERRLASGGLINPAPVREKWDRLIAGQGAWHFALWHVLMLEAWRRKWNV